ncbi:DnaB domain protein helicase domain protein [Pseudodesulfovibrio mercurii]|uniref:DNA 5'-3' helicase n=1 Tax=Pseudodesulfovibrio mercurii TaxID=641491 RepID=F0JDX5_9BACT|nr:DnaB-like helicase C-terminal domain-containing protein [Pseudodesulfovibrio mercurii]EGB13415.1 DnaB domain protein helicase domain protein [Pseudodesulfovibrio mercurii]
MPMDFESLAHGKIPPFDLLAEHAVLEGVLRNNAIFHEIIDLLNRQSFYHPDHGAIFAAMTTCYDNNEPIDANTVQTAVEAENRNICLREYLHTCTPEGGSLSPRDIVKYAEQVRDKATLRSLIQLGNKIATMAYNSQAPLVTLNEAEKELFELKRKTKTFDKPAASEVIMSVLDTINSKFKQGNAGPGLKTGFEDLDSLLSGLRKGSLTVLAGRPGNCIQPFALNVVLKAALSNVPTFYVSLDKHHDRIMEKLLAIHVGIPIMKIQTGQLVEDDWLELYKSAGRISRSGLFFDSAPALSPFEISSRIRHMKNEHDIGLVVIDRVQLIKDMEHPAGGLEQEAAAISRALKHLASELNISILVLSELNSEVDERQDNEPKLSDLLCHGAYEQAADTILLLYRDAEYYEGDESLTDGVDVHVAKNRYGLCGKIELLFHRDCLRLRDLGTGDPLFNG